MDVDKLMLLIQNLGFEVHRNLKPGYVESVYENALAYELRNAGLDVKQQQSIQVFYKGYEVGFLQSRFNCQ